MASGIPGPFLPSAWLDQYIDQKICFLEAYYGPAQSQLLNWIGGKHCACKLTLQSRQIWIQVALVNQKVDIILRSNVSERFNLQKKKITSSVTYQKKSLKELNQEIIKKFTGKQYSLFDCNCWTFIGWLFSFFQCNTGGWYIYKDFRRHRNKVTIGIFLNSITFGQFKGSIEKKINSAQKSYMSSEIFVKLKQKIKKYI